MRKAFTIVFFLFFSYLIYSGVLSAVKGKVIDQKTGQKISKVKITIENLRIKNIKYTITSNEKGEFYKSGLQPGNYSIIYEKKGYIPKRRVVRVGISETVDIGTKLEPIEESKLLPENEVKKAIKTFEKGNYKSAIKSFQELLKKEPNNPVYYFYIASSYEKLKEIDQAIDFYKKSLKIKKDFGFSLQKLGTIYAKKGNFKEALEYYKEAIKTGEVDADTYYNAGVCYINLGDNQNAKKTMEKVLELDPEYSDAYYQLGLIYLGLGDIKRAKELLNKFIEIDPDNKNVSTAKSILKSLK